MEGSKENGVSSQSAPVSEKAAVDTIFFFLISIEMQEFSFKYLKPINLNQTKPSQAKPRKPNPKAQWKQNECLLCESDETWKQAPQRDCWGFILEDVQTWQHGPKEPVLDFPDLSMMVGLDDLHRYLPLSIILQFCNIGLLL